MAKFNEPEDEHGQVVYTLLQGLKVKTARLVAIILEALQRLLNSDQDFGVQGHSLSVYQKMRDLEAPRYLEALTTHPNEQIYSSAVAIYELYLGYDQEFGDNDMEIADSNDHMEAQSSSNQYNGMQFTI